MKTIFIPFILSLLIASSALAQANLSIVFIGNSITQGKGGDDGMPPPTHAVDFLKAQKGAGDIAFANVGRSGSTTLDWLPGSGKYFALATKAADSLYQMKDHQLIFSMKLGTNDSAMQGPNGSPVSPENYKANLTAIINELLTRYPGSKVIIHHPIWYSTNTYNSSKYLTEGLERLNSYIPQIDALISNYQSSQSGRVFKGDTKAYKYFKKHAETLFKPENGQQGIFYLHPNVAGTGILGRYWGKAMAKRFL